MNDPKVFENHCAICKKREATQLCDYVMRYNRGLIFTSNFKHFKEINEGGHDDTCDLPLCKECSHEQIQADLCPHHHELQKKSELPAHLNRARMRQKAKLWRTEPVNHEL